MFGFLKLAYLDNKLGNIKIILYSQFNAQLKE